MSQRRKRKVSSFGIFSSKGQIHSAFKDNTVLWLDAAQGFAPSQWNDQTDFGNDATQGTALDQLAKVNDVINGLPVIRGDGVTDHMILPSALYSLTNGANSIFCVSKRNVDSGAQILFTVEKKTSNFYSDLFYGSSAGDVGYRNNDGIDFAATATGITTTDFNIISSSYDGSTGQSISINGASPFSLAQGSLQNDADSATIFGGSAAFYTAGDMAELIVLNRDTTAQEKLFINTYLAIKFGLALV